MNQDNKSSEKIGEYKLQESEYSSDYTAQATPPKQTPPKIPKMPSAIKNKYVIIGAIVIVLFVAFRFFVPRKQTQTKKPTTPTTKPTPKQSELMLSARLTSIQQQITDNSNNLAQLKQTISQLQTTINNLRYVTESLSKSVQKNSQNMLQLLARQRVVTPGKRKAKMIYHIRAIVPGRAWIEGPDGSLITVSPGFQLKTYGKVTEINVKKGVVKTDKGFVISYGKDEI